MLKNGEIPDGGKDRKGMKTMRKGWTALLLGLLLLCGARGRAEVTVQLSPETARVGEIV